MHNPSFRLFKPEKPSNDASTFAAIIPKMPLMTIAVGAICDQGKTVIVAADQLVTFPQLNLHIEGAVSKIVTLTPHVVSVLTGAIIDGDEILTMARPRIESLGNDPSVDKVVEAIRQAFETFKTQRVERFILRPISA